MLTKRPDGENWFFAIHSLSTLWEQSEHIYPYILNNDKNAF